MSPVTVSPLRQRMIEDMNARKLCAATQRGHIHSCKWLAAFLKRSNGAELWRRLTARGFHSSLRVVGEWATRRRRAEKANAENLQRIPSARTIARFMTIGRDTLSKAETVTVAAIEAGVPTLVEAREIIADFHLMIRRKAVAGQTPWIERARTSLVASFANGVAKDEAAVRAAITLPWSNGQTEGQITRLKLVRRKCTAAAKSTCFRPD